MAFMLIKTLNFIDSIKFIQPSLKKLIKNLLKNKL